MLQVRVTRKTMDAKDIATLELASTDEVGQPLPAFSAGSHVDVHLPNGMVRSIPCATTLRSSIDT